MSDREKLVELMQGIFEEMRSAYPKTFAVAAADHLIASDVEIVVHCKDCKYCRSALGKDSQVHLFCEQWDDVPINASDYCSYGEKREEAKAMNDKEKLIELLSYFGDGYREEERHIVPFTRIVPIVDFLIANGVTVQKYGRWEEYQIPRIMCCSECDWGTDTQSDFKYCPNCGANMRGESDVQNN